MQVSAEVRWFGDGELPASVRKWWNGQAAFSPGNGDARCDEYLRDAAQTELGIKRRGGQQVEVKGLVDVLASPITLGGAAARVQLWSKWPSGALEIAGAVVRVEKVRTIRKFDTSGAQAREIELGGGESGEDPKHEPRPNQGCNVELTELTVEGKRAWTFGLESFALGVEGRQLEVVEAGLRRTAAEIGRRGGLELAGVTEASYPAWLARRAAKETPGLAWQVTELK